jgi:hypothetical protein
MGLQQGREKGGAVVVYICPESVYKIVFVGWGCTSVIEHLPSMCDPWHHKKNFFKGSVVLFRYSEKPLTQFLEMEESYKHANLS